jgi:hypothetical protein
MEEGIGPVVLNRFGGRGARYAANPVTVPGFAPPETASRIPGDRPTPQQHPDGRRESGPWIEPRNWFTR